MPQLRDFPYIWATWLPRLLTGERSCEWAIWFKAHYWDWTRQPRDFDQSKWLLDHTALLHQQKAEWEERGYDVYVEAQNSFQLRGRTATLAGRPDLIVDRGDDALIIDVKTGQEQPWHAVQIQIYQYALPKALPERFRHARLAGEVVYPSRIARVPRGALPGQFIDQLGSTIRRLATPNPPKPTPSFQECRFCDITAADCPERVDEPNTAPQGQTSDF